MVTKAGRFAESLAGQSQPPWLVPGGEEKRGVAPPDSHLVLGCGGLYGDSLGPTARPCIVYYLVCVLS
jgi:hypothetical protein